MRTALITLLVLAFIQLRALGETSNPYANVSRRNVFGLKAPSAAAVGTPPKPASVIKWFGTANVLGYTEAVVQINGSNYILREGEVRDGVQVVKIGSTGSIQVLDHGEPRELSFDTQKRDYLSPDCR